MAKFPSTSNRDRVIARIRDAKFKVRDKLIWSRMKTSLTQRAIEKFLFGLRKLLIGWGSASKQIKIDIDGTDKTLYYDNVFAVKVTVDNNQLSLEWDTEWKTWKELHDAPELYDLISNCNNLLQKGASTGKGKSKGKKDEKQEY